MTHDEMIEVIKAHKAGKSVEYRRLPPDKLGWRSVTNPSWNFLEFEYRVKREPRVLYARISEQGHVCSSDIDKTVIEKLHRLYGGKVVKFVEVMED